MGAHVNAQHRGGAKSIVMRATLHDRATNTPYGQWLGKKARKHRARWEAIAHNELTASA
jgi:hypothetical protein